MTNGKIETTLGILVDVEPALRRVSERDGLSEKTKYHVAKLARLVASETRYFYQQRIALFQEFGIERNANTAEERREHGQTLREIPPNATKVFCERLAEVSAVSVTINWAPVRSVELGPTAKASDFVDLGPLCELVEPEAN